jgi:hypothetical protein
MKFNVQYSKPTDQRIAVSDWNETITEVEASTIKDAISKVNKRLERTIGTWLILDCWEV